MVIIIYLDSWTTFKGILYVELESEKGEEFDYHFKFGDQFFALRQKCDNMIRMTNGSIGRRCHVQLLVW